MSHPIQNKAPEDKNPWWIFPILVGVNNTPVDGSTPMPINIYKLGHETGEKSILLRMLVELGVAMNSGNKNYHHQIKSQFPDIVVEYIECGPGSKYNLVQLKVAATQPAVEAEFTNGTLSSIIRYKTPFFVI